MVGSKAILVFKGVKSSPISNSTTSRSVIREMCRTLKLDYKRLAGKNGVLDENDQRAAREALRRKPNCRIKLVVIE